MPEQYITVLVGVAASAVAGILTLAGVAVSQRSAHRLQQGQAEAAAALDKERREHEASLELARRTHASSEEHARREHESAGALWKQRCAVYTDFEAEVDRMLNHALLMKFTGPGAPTIPDVEATNVRLQRAESLLYLVAPKETAKLAALTAQLVRSIGVQSNPKAQAGKVESLKHTRYLFLLAARKDLGIHGDFLDFAYGSKDSEQP